MKTLLITTLFTTLLLMSSCGSVSETGYVALLSHTKVFTDTIRADLDITNELIEAEASASYLFGIWTSGDSHFTETMDEHQQGSFLGGRINKLKRAAVYNALNKSRADMILTPQYVAETKSYLGIFKTYKVYVKGYKASVKNIYQDKDGQRDLNADKKNVQNSNYRTSVNNSYYEEPYIQRPVTTVNERNNNTSRQRTTYNKRPQIKETPATVYYTNGAEIKATIIGEPENGLVKLRLENGNMVQSSMSDIEEIAYK